MHQWTIFIGSLFWKGGITSDRNAILKLPPPNENGAELFSLMVYPYFVYLFTSTPRSVVPSLFFLIFLYVCLIDKFYSGTKKYIFVMEINCYRSILDEIMLMKCTKNNTHTVAY